MTYGFNTDDKNHALSALVIYQIYRSRDTKKFKISLKMWTQIADFAKLAAATSHNLAQFIEKFKEPMICGDVRPFAKALAQELEFDAENRHYLTEMLGDCEHDDVLFAIENETAYIIMYVRERLEIDKEPTDQDEELAENLKPLKELADHYGDTENE
jgi:hypothetical protein